MIKTIFFAITILISISIIFSQDVLALTIDLITENDDPKIKLIDALLAPDSGITVIPKSENFVGAIGDGNDPDTAQSATYMGFDLKHSKSGMPSISNPDGILLTTGIANIPFKNTSADFGYQPCNNESCANDQDLFQILNSVENLQLDTITNDVNFLYFEFTVDSGATAVEADFVFGSDEFPDQGVTDVFAFIVDGKNYAYFQDNSLISFIVDSNKSHFNENTDSNYNLEYDGISNRLHVTGSLDDKRTTHTLKIAIADTSDSNFDSGVFIGNLRATSNANTIGIEDESIEVTIPIETPAVSIAEPDPMREPTIVIAAASASVSVGVGIASSVKSSAQALAQTTQAMQTTQTTQPSQGREPDVHIDKEESHSQEKSESGDEQTGLEQAGNVEISISGGIEK